ncbi:Fc.00g092040.m01.CDS01 [Cosmosporella sp. VM-42]
MENASGRSPLRASLKSSFLNLLTRPHSLLLSKPFALIFLLYGSTYLTANAVDTASSTFANKPASSVTAGTTKFAASSATNIGICIYKDQVFVKMFGPVGVVPRPIPMGSYGLFAIRDCMTIFASFNIPPLLAPYLNNHLSSSIQKHVSGLSTAQFLAPAAVQLISTPLHLLGLDLYNRPTVASLGERWEMVRKNWTVSAAARICRIVPAFGVGGVVNMKVRRGLMERLE